jgi:hypothetical protein
MSTGGPEPRLRVYFSARSARQAELQRFAEQARAVGLEVSSRWVQNLSADAHSAGRLRAAEDDLEDLASSDVCVAFTDGPLATSETPTSSAGSGGRHVEFGYALASGLRLLVVGPREHLFHELPAVPAAADWPTGLELLRAWLHEPKMDSAPTRAT